MPVNPDRSVSGITEVQITRQLTDVAYQLMKGGFACPSFTMPTPSHYKLPAFTLLPE